MRAIGYVDDATIYSVSGWIADLDDLAISGVVVITVNDLEIARVDASSFRAGLDTIATGATGRYAFKHYFDYPLSPFAKYRLTVRMANSDFLLNPGEVVLSPLSSGLNAPATTPPRPLLVTTMGRSGSTLLMSLLASHPAIVVADERPYEVELITYYAYALRAMTTPGDHERSWRPDRITAVENRFALGLNPYLEGGFRLRFTDQNQFNAFVHNDVPARLGPCFRAIIEAFYGRVVADRKKHQPLYFAEKALPEPLIRDACRFMFGPIKNVVLVRDLRDAICSFMKFGRIDFELAFDSLVSSSDQILGMVEADPEIHVIRYEELALETVATMDRLLRFLGLAANDFAADSQALFNGHATSADVQSSIGRWRRELTPDLLQRCVRFDAFHRRFGYLVPSEPISALTTENDLPLSDLMLRFESLGENCEFGLVQRRCGAEPLGLLRFASAPFDKLMAALRSSFEGIGQPENIEVQLSTNGREYMVLDRCYGLFYHAWALKDELSPEQVADREARRVPFLVRKLIEDLTLGEKIFVYHGMDPLTEGQARELTAAIRRFGPGTLLWVEKMDALHPAGSVEELGDGLIKAYVDRFAPVEDASDLSLEVWIDLCRATHSRISPNPARLMV